MSINPERARPHRASYYYGACVDAVSDESDTTNNCSTPVAVAVGEAPAPDLVVDTAMVSDSAPAAGASFTLSAAVRNQGSGPSASTTLRYYQSTDSAISSSDTPVGTGPVGGLPASGYEQPSVGQPDRAVHTGHVLLRRLRGRGVR